MPTKHYRLKNDSLCLQVSMPAKSDHTWSFNKTEVIVHKNTVTPHFINKVDYYPESRLCINKLTYEDSGIYTILVISPAERQSKMQTYTHILQVQGKCIH